MYILFFHIVFVYACLSYEQEEEVRKLRDANALLRSRTTEKEEDEAFISNDKYIELVDKAKTLDCELRKSKKAGEEREQELRVVTFYFAFPIALLIFISSYLGD